MTKDGESVSCDGGCKSSGQIITKACLILDCPFCPTKNRELMSCNLMSVIVHMVSSVEPLLEKFKQVHVIFVQVDLPVSSCSDFPG